MSTRYKTIVAPLGSTEHLEALGAVSLTYNVLESFLLSFVEHYLKPQSPETAPYLFATLNNRERVDLIKTLAKSEPNPQALDAIIHAMDCFDICAENRNLIMHALPALRPRKPGDALRVVKGSRKDPTFLNNYEFSDADIQAVVVGMYDLAGFMVDILTTIGNIKGTPPASLDKPPKQRKLSLFLPPANQAASPPPPQSSEA